MKPSEAARIVGLSETGTAIMAEDDERPLSEVLRELRTHATYLEYGGRGKGHTPDGARWLRGAVQYERMIVLLTGGAAQ